jgi:ABC-type bacteriocin/lantibiotic exporter with double-glycine peptidase domain
MTVGDLLADSGEHATPAQRLAVLRRVGLERALATGELSLATRVGPFGGGVSGGQRQMLALACALLQGDDVLLLDEPTLGLDSTALGLVVSLLAELKGTRTIVIATHATEIIDLADRLIVVGDGRVLADGPRDKLIVPNRPAAVPRAV